MIEKMKFVSLTGPREDIDRMVMRYLSRYDIHLENALTELSEVRPMYRRIRTRGCLRKPTNMRRLRKRALRRRIRSHFRWTRQSTSSRFSVRN